MPDKNQQPYKSALEWYVNNGVDEALNDEPSSLKKYDSPVNIPGPVKNAPEQKAEVTMLGKSEAYAEAVRSAREANTLEELKNAIAAFEGLSIKNTATNLVFCDGNPEASVMLVGEAPGADEDRLGKPFVGVSGQLLDKILKCIDLDRQESDPQKAIYISNILNWRPPGNRTPSPAEVEVSLPFIEKHIALIKPKLLILCGGVSAKALLNTTQGISRLRKTWHDYTPLTKDLGLDAAPIPAIATYHPAYLLRTPSQKRAVWQDMLMFQEKYKSLKR